MEDFLVVVCENKHLVKVAEIFDKNGVKLWNDRPWNNLHFLYINGSQEKIRRIGRCLIGLRNSKPGVRLEMVDSKGFI